ncbi:hypothetical protein SCUP515_06324 [Seiridium cupressi]
MRRMALWPRSVRLAFRPGDLEWVETRRLLAWGNSGWSNGSGEGAITRIGARKTFAGAGFENIDVISSWFMPEHLAFPLDPSPLQLRARTAACHSSIHSNLQPTPTASCEHCDSRFPDKPMSMFSICPKRRALRNNFFPTTPGSILEPSSLRVAPAIVKRLAVRELRISSRQPNRPQVLALRPR